MKRKLLYLLPIVLAVLCLTPFALYKDTVGFSGKTPVFESLAPSHWKLLDYDVSASVTLSDANATTSKQAAMDANPPLSTGATSKGFPFGAYFKKSSSQNSASVTSSYTVSAWSWLWAVVDGLLIVVSFLVAMKLNRRAAAPASAPVMPPVPANPAPTFTPSINPMPQFPPALPVAPTAPTVVQPQAMESDAPSPVTPAPLPSTPEQTYQPQIVTPQAPAQQPESQTPPVDPAPPANDDAASSGS